MMFTMPCSRWRSRFTRSSQTTNQRSPCSRSANAPRSSSVAMNSRSCVICAPPGGGSLGSNNIQRVPRSMLLTTRSARRFAASERQSARHRAGPGERAGPRHFATGPAHGLHGIHAGGREAPAQVVVHRASRAQARAHHGFLAAGAGPDRPALRGARQHARDGAGRREGLEAAAQLVVAEQAREEHAGGVGRQWPVAHLGERLRRAVPGDRRIHEQDRAPLAAKAVGDEQRARADVRVARERRDAQQVEAVARVQREEAGSARGRADDVVIGERGAVVRVRAREHVAGEPARVLPRRRVGPRDWHLARDARQRRFRQHGADRARRVRARWTRAGRSPGPRCAPSPACARAGSRG